jgi:hypothetical protein
MNSVKRLYTPGVVVLPVVLVPSTSLPLFAGDDGKSVLKTRYFCTRRDCVKTKQDPVKHEESKRSL